MDNPVGPAKHGPAQNKPVIELAVFEAMPGNSILVALDSPRFSILAVTNGMTRRSGLTKAELLNKPFFDPFPANPFNPDDPNSTGQNLMFQSFEHVIRFKETHQLPILRYDLEDDQGIFHELYWKVFNKPVFDDQQNVLYILHTSEDITSVIKTQKRDEELDVIEEQQRRFRKELRESHERFNAAIDATNGVLWTNNPEGRMTGEQKAWSALTGQEFMDYQDFGWAAAVHPEDAAATVAAWQEAVKAKKSFAYQHRLFTKDKGYRTFSVRAIPLLNPDRSVREWVGIHTDITDQQLTEYRIRESEQRFRNLADDSPMFVFIIQPDAAATVTYWNKTWLDYTGQNHEEAMGRAWNGIIHADDVPVVMKHYGPAFQNQESYFIPAVRVKRKDGEYRWYAFKGNPRYQVSGVFDGYVGVGFDIHEQKLAEEALKQSEERLRLAIEAARLGTFEVNISEQTMLYSDRAAEIFGLDQTRQWPYDTFITAVFHEDLPIRNHAHERAKITGELFYEARIQRADDGTLRFMRLNGKYFKRDLTDFYIGTVIDITDEKRSSELLEQKINERTRELKQVNDKLTQFAYSASHDLQEPLRKISILLDRLLITLGPDMSEDNKDLARRIQQTTGRMRMLIDDLLEYSNTTLGITAFEQVDLDEIVASVIDDLEVVIRNKNGHIQAGNLGPVTGDRRQLRQLFQNLIDNALKYSDSSRAPVINIASRVVTGEELKQSVQFTVDGDRYVEITMIDNGIGFSDADAERIFNLFYRLHGKEEFQGTGIGLAIVQKVIENHKGQIRAEGVPGEGSRFTFYLPDA